MNNKPLAMNLLDFIFPKTCVWCGKIGTYICRNCFSKIEFVQQPICPECQRQAIGGETHPGCKRRYGLDGLIVACKYQGSVRAAIQKIKYRFAWDIHKILVDLISESLWRYEFPKNVVLGAIPLYARRENWRGFNQAELLARDLAARFREKYERELLIRTVDGKTQVGLTREQRKENIKGVFKLSQNAKVESQNFILVDDVFTTGATAKEACKVLKRAGAGEVWALAVALD